MYNQNYLEGLFRRFAISIDFQYLIYSPMNNTKIVIFGN